MNVNLLPAGLAVVVLEFHFAIDAVSNLVSSRKTWLALTGNGHHVADENLFQRLSIEFARGCASNPARILRATGFTLRRCSMKSMSGTFLSHFWQVDKRLGRLRCVTNSFEVLHRLPHLDSDRCSVGRAILRSQTSQGGDEPTQ